MRDVCKQHEQECKASSHVQQHWKDTGRPTFRAAVAAAADACCSCAAASSCSLRCASAAASAASCWRVAASSASCCASPSLVARSYTDTYTEAERASGVQDRKADV